MLAWTREVDTAVRLLEAAGHEAYLVGGALRDALLGKPPKDCDLACSAPPEEVSRVLAAYRVIETGLRHGTVTVLIDGVPIEITTYRADSDYSDGRHPDGVRFVRDIRTDLSRRDFTVNALAYHPERGLLDFFGGAADLQRGLIRCVGAPEKRFSEDGLRVLRALRFASVLGFTVEEETRAALLSSKHMLEKISAERLSVELTGLLCGRAVRPVLLDYIDVLGVVLPELLPMKDFPQQNPYHIYDVLTHTAVAVERIAPEPVLRWTMLLHDVAKPLCHSRDAEDIDRFYGHERRGEELARDMLQRLRFDRETTERVTALVAHHDLLLEAEPRRVRRALGRLTPPLFFALLAVKRADCLAQAPRCRARLAHYNELEEMAHTLLAEAGVFSRSDLAVNGNDLLARGVRGKEIGRRLQILLEAVMEETLPNERGALLAFLGEEANFEAKNGGES